MDDWNNFQKEDLDGEIWRSLSNFSNYKFSNFGRVKILKLKKFSRYKKEEYPFILKQNIDHKGYCIVSLLRDDGVRKGKRVHRLVAEVFIENDINKDTVNHLDNVKTNNHVSNLEWATNLENMQHSYKYGYRDGCYTGEKNANSNVTEQDVVYIYKNPDRKTRTELRKEFGLSISGVNSIYSGKNWSYLTKDLTRNSITLHDMFIKCVSGDTVHYAKGRGSATDITGVKTFSLDSCIKDGKERKGWRFYRIDYDEYLTNTK